MNENAPLLTVVIPTYNMSMWLERDLATFCDTRFNTRLEVIIQNNASEDDSGVIAQGFCDKYPAIFTLNNRNSRGYGSSINDGLAQAAGVYFRIIDADDWVETDELARFLDFLETCTSDVVVSDYHIVNMQTGEHTSVRAADKGIPYYYRTSSLTACKAFLPSIHALTYRTSLLRDNGFIMQDMLYFVDEEYVILPFLNVKSVIFTDCSVYRYQVANPEQSMSPKNRAKYREHREKVLRRLLRDYEIAERNGASDEALSYCRERIVRGVGDHFTTLYIYVQDRKSGYKEAEAWISFLQSDYSPFWEASKAKADKLRLLNQFNLTLKQYEFLKRIMGYRL
jgi:glycosyltransferase involved in cell wall biosynthesis